MGSWKRESDIDSFHEDAAEQMRIHEELAWDIMRTLPEEEWPVWVKNRARALTDPNPWVPIKIPNPSVMDEGASDLKLPDTWSGWRLESSTTFQYQLPPRGIHGLSHYLMDQAGLKATVEWPEGLTNYGTTVVPGPKAVMDMLTSMNLGDQAAGGQITDTIFVTVTTDDNPADVMAVLDAAAGRAPDFNGVSPEIQSVCEKGGLKNRAGKTAAGLGIPATYTPEDPYDIKGKKPLINAMQVDWMNMNPDEQRQVIVNAFRATMLSPRMNLKSNAILYQNLMSVPAEESDPDVFENLVRGMKKKWDAGGQPELGQEPTEVLPVDELAGGGKYMPGFWGNIRRLANLGPYAETLRQLAITDMTEYGGTGTYFRDQLLKMGIPGVQAKVASFAWLALAPNTSELATVDVHMMRHLEQDGLDSPKNTNHYLELEDRLRQERDDTYGSDTPLSWYQWGVWDARRTPGYHQDHTPLRAHEPTPYQNIQWPATSRPPRPKLPASMPENQLVLGSGWQIDPRLARYRKWIAGRNGSLGRQ